MKKKIWIFVGVVISIIFYLEYREKEALAQGYTLRPGSLDIPTPTTTLISTTCGAVDGGTEINCPIGTISQTTQNVSTNAATIWVGGSDLQVSKGLEIVVGVALSQPVPVLTSTSVKQRCVSVAGATVARTQCYQK